MSKVKTKCMGRQCASFVRGGTMKDRGTKVPVENYCRYLNMSLEQMARKLMICPKRSRQIYKQLPGVVR